MKEAADGNTGNNGDSVNISDQPKACEQYVLMYVQDIGVEMDYKGSLLYD